VRQGDPRWDAPVYRDVRHQGGQAPRDPGGRAPVPQSAPRWTLSPSHDAPAYRTPNWTPPASSNEPRRDAPANRGPRDSAPVPQPSPGWTPPAHPDSRIGPGGHDPRDRAPQSAPRWTPPPSHDAPGYHTLNWNPPGHQGGRREEAPRYHRSDPQCGGRASSQQCSGGDRAPAR
jgi:hypothetical protein